MIKSVTLALSLLMTHPGYAGKEGDSLKNDATSQPHRRSSVKEIKKKSLENMAEVWEASWDRNAEPQNNIMPVRGRPNTQVNCLYHCLIRDERQARTFERLHRLAKVQGLTTLYANNVGSEHEDLIVSIIIKNRETLEHINLRRPNAYGFSFRSCLGLCPHLKTVRCNRHDFLTSQRLSSSLSLHQGSFNKSSPPLPLMRELIQKRPQNIPLTELDVDICAPGDIATLIEESPQLCELRLDLSDWDCSVEDLSPIFHAIRRHPRLEALYVSNNRNTKATPSEVLRELVGAIKEHSSLRTLEIGGLVLEPEEAPILGDVLPTIPHFSELNVRSNENFGSKGFEILSPYLARCTQLISMDVGYILNQSSLPHLLTAISGSQTTLQKIDCFSRDDFSRDPSVLTNLFPLAQVLERCPQFVNLRAGYVDWKSVNAFRFLELRSNGLKYDFLKVSFRCEGYNSYIRQNVIEKLASYLGLTIPRGLKDEERYRRSQENRASIGHFLERCRTENIFLLSDPKFEKLLEDDR